MYLGRVVEAAESDSLYHVPSHPYTKALLSAVPNPDPRVERNRQRIILEGELPELLTQGLSGHGRADRQTNWGAAVWCWRSIRLHLAGTMRSCQGSFIAMPIVLPGL